MDNFAWPSDDNGGMRDAAAKSEESYISLFRVFNFSAVLLDPPEIFLFRAMHVPIVRVLSDVDSFDHSSISINFDEDLCAVYTHALDGRMVMIRGSEPCSGFLYHSFPHTAVSGTGMNGCPLKFDRLLNFIWQVTSFLSQPA